MVSQHEKKHTQDLNHNVVSILIIEINIQFQKLVMLTREHFLHSKAKLYCFQTSSVEILAKNDVHSCATLLWFSLVNTIFDLSIVLKMVFASSCLLSPLGAPFQASMAENAFLLVVLVSTKVSEKLACQALV